MAESPLVAIIDDDDSVRESLSSLLRSAGFRAAVFASAEAFLNSDHPSDPDCLLVDLRMPGMSGLELQRHMIKANTKIPIVFITAHGDEEARSRALRDGAVDFLRKPFTEEALLNAVHSALKS
jgi:FixJ family two-component response regulator